MISDSYTLSVRSSMVIAEPWEKEIGIDVPFRGSIPEPLILCMLNDYGSLINSHLLKKSAFLVRALRDTLIY